MLNRSKRAEWGGVGVYEGQTRGLSDKETQHAETDAHLDAGSGPLTDPRTSIRRRVGGQHAVF